MLLLITYLAFTGNACIQTIQTKDMKDCRATATEITKQVKAGRIFTNCVQMKGIPNASTCTNPHYPSYSNEQTPFRSYEEVGH